jgi:superfamily II DNA/RNA helicase
MHELLVRRFKERKWDHVLFHGGVPGGKRKDLVDRFRDDPNCRIFLSTDAGGTGLNLQHATVVLNMDLPWNPAVLEQRIGRVHRLGQKQPVRVINFVAKSTIEEGMLSVIKFKKSLFAGVLDGGDKDVFLGGSRLNKFMETVEAATGAIPESMLEDAEEALRTPMEFNGQPEADGDRGKPARRGGRRRAKVGTGTHAGGTGTTAEVLEGLVGAGAPAAPGGQLVAAPVADPWSGLLQAGLAILQQVANASRSTSAGGTTQAAGGASSLVHRDERTGETYLRLPVPSPEVLDQALNAFGTLLQSFQRR